LTILMSLSVLVFGCLTGCQSFGPLRVEPVVNNRTSELLPNFVLTFYRVDQDGNYWFFFSSRTPVEGSFTGISQTLILRVFWDPKPGVTTLDPSGINTTIRFIVMTPNGSGMYEGSGFVRIHGKPGDKQLTISIVDGEMRLTNSSGYFVDALGPSRITGDQNVIYSPDQTLALIQQARRDFFLATYSQRYEVANPPNAGALP